MNFDTKYLVRWGIPGWILIMILGPFIYIHFKDELEDIAGDVNVLGLGAILTIIGVPLGYLLNQIHHSISWVFMRTWKFREKFNSWNWLYESNRDSWDDYFKKELKLDDYFNENKENEKLRIRYTYLLSRKHELGGLTVSLFVTTGVILLTNIFVKNTLAWSWIYFIITFILLVLVWLSRAYSSKNIDVYFKEYIDRAESKK